MISCCDAKHICVRLVLSCFFMRTKQMQKLRGLNFCSRYNSAMSLANILLELIEALSSMYI